MITAVDVYDLRLPLAVPYGNSMGVLTHFTTLLAVLYDENGTCGVGEATPAQPGYQHESPESIWQFLCDHAREALGLNAHEAIAAFRPFQKAYPFACTALITAAEELSNLELLQPPQQEMRFELVGIVNPPKGMPLEEHLEQRIAQGYRTLKVKIGFGVEQDIQKVKRIAACCAGRVKLRLDANQAYSFDDAVHLMRHVDPAEIELLEQPFDVDQWEQMQRLSRVATLPLMLDESIYGIEEVRRAGELGCAKYIKFKLMKSASAADMAEQIQAARSYGIQPLIGNGVAADVGCYHETLIGARCGVTAAGEQNGYLKPTAGLFVQPLEFEQGQMVIPTGYRRALNLLAIQANCIHQARYTL